MTDDLYNDDDTHPIPRVGTIDAVTALKGGGAYYGLVIARPIQADHRSQKRLLKKLENYVEDFFSEDARRQFGTGGPGSKMQIHVGIHEKSDRAMFDLLERCRPWLEDNHILLVIKRADLTLKTSG